MKQPQPISDSALVLGAFFVACTTVCIGLFADPQAASQFTATWNTSMLGEVYPAYLGLPAVTATPLPPLSGATAKAGSTQQSCVKEIKNSVNTKGGLDYECVPGCVYTVQMVFGTTLKVVPAYSTPQGSGPGYVYFKAPSLLGFGGGSQGPFTCGTSVAATMQQNVPSLNATSWGYQAVDASGATLSGATPAISTAFNGGTAVGGQTCTGATCLQNMGIPGNYEDLQQFRENDARAALLQRGIIGDTGPSIDVTQELPHPETAVDATQVPGATGQLPHPETAAEAEGVIQQAPGTLAGEYVPPTVPSSASPNTAIDPCVGSDLLCTTPAQTQPSGTAAAQTEVPGENPGPHAPAVVQTQPGQLIIESPVAPTTAISRCSSSLLGAAPGAPLSAQEIANFARVAPTCIVLNQGLQDGVHN